MRMNLRFGRRGREEGGVVARDVYDLAGYQHRLHRLHRVVVGGCYSLPPIYFALSRSHTRALVPRKTLPLARVGGGEARLPPSSSLALALSCSPTLYPSRVPQLPPSCWWKLAADARIVLSGAGSDGGDEDLAGCHLPLDEPRCRHPGRVTAHREAEAPLLLLARRLLILSRARRLRVERERRRSRCWPTFRARMRRSLLSARSLSLTVFRVLIYTRLAHWHARTLLLSAQPAAGKLAAVGGSFRSGLISSAVA